jgi:hypothetical protein
MVIQFNNKSKYLFYITCIQQEEGTLHSIMGMSCNDSGHTSFFFFFFFCIILDILILMRVEINEVKNASN